MREREQVLRGLPMLGPDLYFASVNWLLGTMHGAQFKSEVRDPPTCGWGTCLLIDRLEDDRGKPVRQVTLFAMNWFDSWQVSRRCLEYQSLQHPEHFRLMRRELIDQDSYDSALKSRLATRLKSQWQAIERYGWQKDFDTAALIMRRLGEEVPLATVREGATDKVSGGKEVSKAGLIKPVKRSSRKGQVLDFFWPEVKAIRECMAEMGISRSNVLSQLYLLQKDHGIGYELKNDAAIITMPNGCDWPWEEKDPLA